MAKTTKVESELELLEKKFVETLLEDLKTNSSEYQAKDGLGIFDIVYDRKSRVSFNSDGVILSPYKLPLTSEQHTILAEYHSKITERDKLEILKILIKK